jgi:hypothetical protein
MAQPDAVTLSPVSRYRNTRVLKDLTSRMIFFGVWRPPPIQTTLPEIIHMVTAEETGRPDLIAYRVYGNSSLFWAIALRNNIIFPLRDIRAGQRLFCPASEDVASALTRSGPRSPDAG